MEGASLKNILFGFLAGVIATVTIHELIKCYLFDAGAIPLKPWDMSPVGPWDVPHIVSASFWGGLWGSILALIFGNQPHGSMTLRGIVFGLIGPAILGALLWVPLIKGQAPFFDGEPVLIGSVLLILAGWGAVTAWLYGFFTSGCRLP